MNIAVKRVSQEGTDEVKLIDDPSGSKADVMFAPLVNSTGIKPYL
jgi:hypothetical protein